MLRLRTKRKNAKKIMINRIIYTEWKEKDKIYLRKQNFLTHSSNQISKNYILYFYYFYDIDCNTETKVK